MIRKWGSEEAVHLEHEHLATSIAADLVTRGLSSAITDKQITYDLARLMEPQVDPVSCSGFAEAIIERF